MRFCICVTLASLLCPVSTFAQSPLGVGTVSGQIIEAGSHDGLPDSTVTLANDAMGFRRVAKTTDDGFFTFPSVPPGSGFVITVRRKDFADFLTTPFIVFVGRTLEFTINQERLADTGDNAKPPAPVPVDAGSLLPQVETTKLGIGQTLRKFEIDDLPSDSRLLENFAPLSLGVTRNTATAEMNFVGLEGTNVFFTDGVLATNTYFGQRPGMGITQSQDATYELQVYSAGGSVEYGHGLGGALNAASPRGTSQIHGSLYGYERIPSLGVASRFALGQNLLQKQNQEGASVGGPVVPHKLFFFANAELHSGHFDGMNRILNPLIADSTGTTVSSANCKATAAECASAIKLIQPQMNVPLSFTDRWLTALGRLDYQLNQKHQFGAEVNGMNLKAPLTAEVNAVAPNGGLLGIGNDVDSYRMAKGYWNFSPYLNMTNNLRGSWLTDKYSQPPSTPGATGTLGLVIAGTTIGDSQADPLTVHERRWDATDNFTITSLNHVIQAGIEYMKRSYDVYSLPNQYGLYIYPTLTAFANDLGGINQKNYESFMQGFGDPSSAPWVRERNVWAQDTYRMTSRITIVGGVRWDHFKVSQPTPSPTSFFNTGAIAAPNVDWAPRVGVAFQADPHTVIRVGYSWFYEPLPGNLLDAMYRGDAVLQQEYNIYSLQSNGLIYPKVFPNVATANLSGGLELFTAMSKLRSPRTQQIMASIEKRLSNDFSLTLSFIDSRGYKLYSAADTNFAAPSANQTYNIDNSSATQVGTYSTPIYTARTDNSHGHVYQVQNGGSSYYTGGGLQLQKRMGHGFAAELQYTYAKAQTDAAGPLVFGVAPNSYTPANLAADRGTSPIGQRNHGSLGFIWRPTLGAKYMSAARALVNGWAFTSMVTVASGGAGTALTLISGQQFSAASMLYPSSLNGSGGWSTVPFEGTGNLRTGSIHTWDARVSRDFTFADRVKALVLIEGFNILNDQYTTAVNDIKYIATAGTIRPATGYGLPIAAQGFPQGTNARSVQAAFRVTF